VPSGGKGAPAAAGPESGGACGADATAIVLAGGKSSRMGEPKALLAFDGEPLIAHTVRLLASAFAHVIVVAAPGQPLPSLPARRVDDELPHQGPVGGICYGLKATTTAVAFVASCDAPFLNLGLISYLVSRSAGHDVVVPRWQERLQPLHAVYHRSVVPRLEEQLARGELRPVTLYERVRTRIVGEEEIRRFDPEGSSFWNMNTPDDYRAALARWEERKRSALAVTVELFGVARLLAKTRSVSLPLPAEATLAEVCGALAAALPELRGRVIAADGNALARGYACNLNGLDFLRDPAAVVRPGDRLLILSADAGG
jgi:molybdopterin-guanine dinucleotide biosynthesis protein A